MTTDLIGKEAARLHLNIIHPRVPSPIDCCIGGNDQVVAPLTVPARNDAGILSFVVSSRSDQLRLAELLGSSSSFIDKL